MGSQGFAGFRAVFLSCTLLLCFSTAHGQTVIDGDRGVVHTFNSDQAVLEAQEERKDLPCTVEPMAKAALGFDLRFHAGYEVTIPMRELAGSENLLTMIFRVTPASGDRRPVYFSQHFNVPKIPEETRSDAYLQGSFDLGEGSYHVDFLMRDRSERVCSAYWDTTAVLPPKDREVHLPIAAGTVEASDREPFKEEPPVTRDEKASPLNVKVMVNFAPQRAASATMQPLDVNALVSILRNISREPRICKFTIVAFNMQEQRVLYRQEESEQINFPALGESLNSMKLGVIDLKRLENKHADSSFLSTLVAQEMTNSHPDALIFAGPKIMLDEGISQETIGQLESINYPVFYMNYNLYPQANPWRDSIGTAVKKMKGYEYTISRPRDLWVAWSEIISRIVRLKGSKLPVSAGLK